MRVSLGLLKDYVSHLLVEGRVDDAREKYPDIEEEDWQQLVANQPAGSNNKYLMWCAGQVDDGFSVEVVVQTIRLFDGNVQRLQQKDINQYKDVGAVEKAIDELPKKQSKSQEQKQARADTDKIYEDERWLVVRPHTQDASCKYGAGTRWCIAATASRNYFHTYSESNNKFYFVIDKNGTPGAAASKYALAIIAAGQSATGDRIQVYDASDKLVNMNVVSNLVGDKWPEIWRKIEEHVRANPITREVEDAARAVEEDIKNLLKGEKVSEQVLSKIAQKGKLTTAVVKAIIDRFKDYEAPRDWYQDKRSNIMSSLSDRSDQMEPAAATMTLKWITSARPANLERGGHWSGNYYLERMLKQANLDAAGFRDLASTGDETVLAQIFGNPACPEDVKNQIAGAVARWRDAHSARKVYWDMIKSGKITMDQFREAMRKDSESRSSYDTVTYNILNHPEQANLTPDMIRMLQIKDHQQFKALMQMKNVPPDFIATVLGRMIKGGGMKKYDLYQTLRTVKLGVKEVEQMWADNKEPEARTALLQNPGIGEGNALKFAKSKNSAYRFAIAHNTVTPAEALKGLAKDESVSTRSAVAANTSTPVDTLTALSRDEAVAVRASVASNDKTPSNVLDVLKRDTDDFVRKAARKTIKSRAIATANAGGGAAPTAESMRHMLIVPLLREAMEDDEAMPDVMSPHWSDIPQRGVETAEFISVFLLQNNGHATREEINDAYQNWVGAAGFKELWRTNKYSDEILRGSTAGGKGWYWSPPGINKGALFRLTPSGAAAAMEVLRRFRHYATEPQAQVTSATARAGKTYYTQSDQEALDITGYERGDLTVEEVQADSNGNPVRTGGKYQKLNPDRSRRARWRSQGVKLFKYESPAGETKYVQTFPKVNLPGNTAVQFVKVMYGLEAQSHRKEANRAIVKRGERFLLINFPLYAMEHGAVPAQKEKEKMPPPRKSPPAPIEPPRGGGGGGGAALGPKINYKIYGRKAGKPAHTRLKGQAYGAPADTQFAPGEQAVIQATDDGKLKVKKVGGDHEQTWDPVEG